MNNSVRIELPKNFSHEAVAEWMTTKFGPPSDEPGKETWFWSTGQVYQEESKFYPGLVEEKCRGEGVRIWNTGPKVTEAVLKWSNN